MSAGGSAHLRHQDRRRSVLLGKNDSGQLADGSASARRVVPRKVGIAKDWRSVTAGPFSTCATRSDGTLWCSGNLEGTHNSTNLPQQFGTATNWAVALDFGSDRGGGHACGIRGGNQILVLGIHDSGQLGVGRPSQRTPATVVNTSGWSEISAGFGHTCGLDVNDIAWCWGDNTFGSLGDETDIDRVRPVQVLVGDHWIDVDAGSDHTCGVRSTGTMMCWGISTDPPKQIGTETDWTSVFDGDELSCGLRADSSAWCWTRWAPTPWEVDGSASWAVLSVGSYRACGVRTDGTAWCWHESGEPQQVNAATNWRTITAGSVHACGTRTNGALYCWGENTYGQIGDGTTAYRAGPKQVGKFTTWVTASASEGYGAHTCATKTDGTLWCWGNNWASQIGDGTTVTRLTPRQVGTGATWSSVDTGSQHTCAVRNDGSAGCWGWVGAGQIGNGSTLVLSTPARMVS